MKPVEPIIDGVYQSFDGKTLDSGSAFGFIAANIAYALAHDEIGDDVAQLILETAEKFIQNKCFSWNSGIFLFKPDTFLEEINKYESSILKCCKESLDKQTIDLDINNQMSV